MYAAAYQLLGGKRSEMNSVNASLAKIREGLPATMFENGTELLGITKAEYADLIGENLRNLQRKIKSEGKLSPASSEHALMLTELVRQADQYFSDPEKRKRWFNRPNIALGNVSPISVCDTVTGIQLVSDEINKLKYGFTA